MRLANRPLLVPVLVAASLALSGVAMLFLEQRPDAPIVYHQVIPGSNGADQLHDALIEVFNSLDAPEGTPQNALQDSVLAGFDRAIPPDAGTQLPTRLNAIKGIFEGAMNGATPDVAAPLDAQERAVVEESMYGWALPVFQNLPASPSAMQTAILADLSQGFSSGAAASADGAPPLPNLQRYAVWSEAMADHAVGWVTGQFGSMPPAPLGGEGYGLEAWARGIAQGGLDGLSGAPTSQQQADLQAYAEDVMAWAPGLLLQESPTTLTQPLADAMGAWAQGFSEGWVGSMPSQGPDGPDPAAWEAWREATLGTLIERISAADFQPTEDGADFLLAWAFGMGSNPDDIPNQAPDPTELAEALTFIAGQMVEDATTFLEDTSPYPAERLELVRAWSQAMAEGVQALAPGGGAEPAAMEGWLHELATQVQDIPQPAYAPGSGGAAVLGDYAAASANGLIAIWSGESPETPTAELEGVLRATQEGLNDGLEQLLTERGLDGAPDDAFIAGLLEVLGGDDPVLVGFDAVDYLSAYVAGGLAGCSVCDANEAYRDGRERSASLTAIAVGVYGPALRYTWEKYNTTDPGDLEENVVQTRAWAQATADGLDDVVREAVRRTLDETGNLTWLPGYVEALDAYMAAVVTKATDPPMEMPDDPRPALDNLLNITAQPVRWFVDDDGEVNQSQVDAAKAFAEELITNVNLTDIDEFTAHLVLFVFGTFEGLGEHLGNVTGATPYARAQAEASRAWAIGIAKAITESEPPLGGGVDPGPYRDWARAGAAGAMEGVQTFRDNVPSRQAIQEFGQEVGAWLLGLRDQEPPPPPDPVMLGWFEGFVTGLIGNFTPDPVPDPGAREQLQAARAWMRGVLNAFGDHPPPPGRAYVGDQAAAVEAYLAEVGNATDAFVDRLTEELPDEPGGEPPNVTALVEHLVGEVLRLGPFGPTRGHVEETAAWAHGTATGLAIFLGEQPGPNPQVGPVTDWINWTVASLPLLPGDVADETLPIIDGYASGLMLGAGDFVQHLQGEGLEAPSSDELNRDALADALIGVLMERLLDPEPPLPEDLPAFESLVLAENLARYAVFGGEKALTDSGRAAYGPVKAWTTAFVGHGLEAIGASDPGDIDPDALGQYVGGAMEEGLDRIVNRTPAVAEDQLRAIQAWAEAMGNMTPEDLLRDLDDDPANQTGWGPYAEALASAVQHFPTGPTEAQVAAWKAWGEAMVAAGQGLSTAPTEAGAQRMQAWVGATVAGFAGRLPEFDPGTLTNPDPAAWQAYVEAMASWLEGFAHSAVNDLPRHPPPPDAMDDVAWVTYFVEEASANTCATSAVPRTCATIMGIVGEGTGNALTDLLHDEEPEEEPPQFIPGPPGSGSGNGGSGTGSAEPPEDQNALTDDLVDGVQRALEAQPNADPALLAAMVEGAVEAARGGPASTQAWAEAAIAAVGAHARDLQQPGVPDDAGLAEDLVFAITSLGPTAPGVAAFPALPAGQPDAWAMAIANAVVADLAAQGVVLPVDPAARYAEVSAQVQELLGLDGARPPGGDTGLASVVTVVVSDGRNSAEGDELDGTPQLQGDHTQTVTVLVPPVADAPGATWTAAWTPGAFSAQDSGTAVPLSPSPDGEGYTGTIPAHPAALDGETIQLVVLRTVGNAPPLRVDNNGEPFAYVVDTAEPVFSITAPADSAGVVLPVRWQATDDGSGVAGYTIEVRRDGGAWQPLLTDTAQTSFDYTGVPGATYEFRGTAEDAVGHASDPASAVSRIASSAPAAPPGGAPGGANQAPTVTIVDPVGGAHKGTLTARVNAADPDGTSPGLRVFLEPLAGGPAVPVYSGAPGTFPLDTTGVPDGTYRLHAVADDGTLRAESRGSTFEVDNTMPRIAGPKPAMAHEGGITLLAQVAGAEVVQVSLSPKDAPGQVQRYVMRDDGTGGDTTPGDDWYSVAIYGLPEGEYQATMEATDDAGNKVTRVEEVYVANTPALSELPGAGGEGPGSSGSGGATPPGPGGDLGVVPLLAGFLVLAALGAAAWQWQQRKKKQP